MKKTTHKTAIVDLRRIEGQIKGIQNMIEEEKYCIDIVNQIHAAIHGLYRVSGKVFKKHIKSCAMDAFKSNSEAKKIEKVEEIMRVIQRLYKVL